MTNRDELRQRALVLCLVATCATACGTAASTSASHSNSLRIASVPSGGSGSTLALLAGVLKGSVSSDKTACFWIDVPTGKRPVVWPADWTAEADPLRVLDGNSHVIASVGDQVSLTGGDLQNNAPAAFCGSVPAFGVGSVQK